MATSPRRHCRATEVALEAVPVVGTGGFRSAQQAEASTAAQKVTGGLQEQLQQTPFRGLAQLDKAADRGNKAAIALKQELADAGDDWNRTVQASGNLQAFRVRQVSDRLYGNVERLAAATHMAEGRKPRPRVLLTASSMPTTLGRRAPA